ncbi:hypothetical protein MLD38_030931 [Melastoma candidum]|uniref:Uncharacterized protein n=1 Tax=Melastoma candidum TaxID=119954 RepID=A0ACB9MRQ8_9MYRT|nr:hypothetical protein MLD38_030931 [Melastoma candidum]
MAPSKSKLHPIAVPEIARSPGSPGRPKSRSLSEDMEATDVMMMADVVPEMEDSVMLCVMRRDTILASLTQRIGDGGSKCDDDGQCSSINGGFCVAVRDLEGYYFSLLNPKDVSTGVSG